MKINSTEKTYPDDSVDAYLNGGEKWQKNHGPLTKREYFAAMAMQGMSLNTYTEGAWKVVAELAVLQADALIAELNK